jgi:uncharacterized protein YgiM (DUF1202 family)
MKTSQFSKMIGAGAAVALLATGAATGAQAQTLIPGVTGCSAPGGKQEAGAVIGAIAGGLIGNKVGGKHATGETVVGAAAGAAAGSAIGCQMQKSRQNSASGYGAPTYTQGGYRLSRDIAPASYNRIGDTFVAQRTVNLRAAPSTDSRRMGTLRAGERFQAMASVRGTDWILVGQDGVGVGYVHGAYARPAGYQHASY